MNGLYSIEELTQSIIDEYQLNCLSDDAFHNYYQRIYRALVSTNILKAGIEEINPATKRKCRYYTEQHRQTILAEKTLYDYVRECSTSKEIYNSKRYKDIQADIKSRRTVHIEYLDSMNQEDIDNTIPTITAKEFQDYKNNIMLTALFEKFFTPINDELLFNDLYQVQILKDELDLQIEDLEAETRLLHPKGSYFHDIEEE